MDDVFDRLVELISSSIVSIKDEYINFQVAGSEERIERERVYCYEFYHQIRHIVHEISYRVNSEPNKINHPYIEDHCGAIDPDFIFHRPGEMNPDSNLAVIEIKKTSGDLTNGILKDIGTINCMTTIPNGYHGGIIIVFGEISDVRQRNLLGRIRNSIDENTKRLTVLLHQQANTPPVRIDIK